MVEKLTPSGDVDSAMSPTRAAPRTFNQWLQSQLKARKLTQRQLAQKSGVDHSTISRLMREDRVPSLLTATLLARSLGIAGDLARLDGDGFDVRGSPTARVEYALRSDDLLSEADVRHVMNVYLSARLRRPRNVDLSATVRTGSSMPVPTVVEVPVSRPRPTSIGLPTLARRRST